MNGPTVWGASIRDLRLSVEAGVDVMGEVVELSALGDSASGPVWNQIAKAGAFRGHSAGPFELNAEVFGDIVRNFKAQSNRRIPIDFEHASESDATSGSIPFHGAPAQGWILDLEVRDGNLWGLVEWLEPARTYVREDKYKFFSPAIRFGSRDRVTGKPIGARLSSGALTNNPFLDGMKPLAAKHTEGSTMPTEEEMTATESPEVVAASDAPEASSVSLKDHEAKVALLTASEAKVSELTLTLADRDAKLSKAEEELVALRAEKAARDEKELAAEVEEAFTTYKDEKKLSDEAKTHMLVVLKASPDAFRALYPKVKPEERHLLRDLSGKDESPAPVPMMDETLGDTRKVTMRDLVDTLMSNNPRITYEDASIQASKILGQAKTAKR